jgi:hypothetical protein
VHHLLFAMERMYVHSRAEGRRRDDDKPFHHMYPRICKMNPGRSVDRVM